LILLSLGTHQQPFPRALDLIEPLGREGLSMTIQYGSTPARPHVANTTWVQFMPFDDVVAIMAQA